MSLIRLANGHKYEIDQPQESESLLRNRQRRTLSLVFRAGEDQFTKIKEDFTPANLAAITVYYPDNETADEPDEQLEGVAHKDFLAYTLVGEWTDKEIAAEPETSTTPAVYTRQLSVTLGERLASDN